MHLQFGPSIDVDRASRGCLILITALGAVIFILGVVIGQAAK